MPKPKNDFALINLCIAKQQSQDSNILVIMFNKKDKDDKVECIEWKFIMADNQLAKKW